jgi:transcription elongation factor GreA
MPSSAGAAGLFRDVGLLVDGPVPWGAAVRSTAPGVYVVEQPGAPEDAPIDIGLIGTWLSRVPTLRLDGDPPTGKALAARLAAYWLPGEPVLYVGRAATSLAGRVNALYRTPLGDPAPHAAAHWLRTLSTLSDCRLWWAETDAPEEAELAILEAFAAAVDPAAASRLPAGEPVLPFACLALPTGERRSHGITGALLPQSTTGGGSAVVSARRPKAARRGTPAGKPAAPRTGRARATAPTVAEQRAAEPVHLTADGMAALDSELADLRDVRRPAAIKRVATARELGDLSENAEYHAAREELGFIEGRIRSLEHRHKRAVVIVAADSQAAGMGSTVVVESDGDRFTYTLVSTHEARPSEGRISVSSPVGAAIVGATPGDEVVVRSPAGEHRLRIVEVG